MLTPQEVLYRSRKGRKNVARAYRTTRKKHGSAAARKLWHEVRKLTDWRPDGGEEGLVWLSRRDGVNTYGDPIATPQA